MTTKTPIDKISKTGSSFGHPDGTVNEDTLAIDKEKINEVERELQQIIEIFQERLKINDDIQKLTEAKKMKETVRQKIIDNLKQFKQNLNEEQIKAMIVEYIKDSKQQLLPLAKIIAQKILYKAITDQPDEQKLTRKTIVDELLVEIEWDEHFMKIACLTALRSKDPKTPVGACIVEKETRKVVGIGYNSMPYMNGGGNDRVFPWKRSDNPGIDKFTDIKLKYPYVVHAAVNAITNRTRDSLEGCTIYLTLYPDFDCAQAIVTAGIKSVIILNRQKEESSEKKEESVEQREELVKKKEVDVEKKEMNVQMKEKNVEMKELSVQQREETNTSLELREISAEETKENARRKDKSLPIETLVQIRSECVQLREECVQLREECVQKREECVQKREDYLQKREEFILKTDQSVQNSTEPVVQPSDNDYVEEFFEHNNIETSHLTLPQKCKEGNILCSKLKKANKTASEPRKDFKQWEDFFMEIAELCRERPGEDRKEDSAQGACIVSPQKQVISVGSSGYPNKWTYPDKTKLKSHQKYITHAEYKAILGGPSVRGCTLYTTLYPCNTCAKLIVQSGITEVVFANEGSGPDYGGSKKTLPTCLGDKNIKKYK